ncbi:hypothetical protein VTP01DRAFT_5928 [Rhizomucor pusillus]|uniref:uncharacterized protein n=1 Tax=Rhizomucor pusillus TaxID=4840 RepID=UPI00374325FF
MSTGIITGHYLDFLKTAMDEMDQYPHTKRRYLVMDNALIHTLNDIAKYNTSRGYRRFLEKETLMTMVTDATERLKPSDYEGFVSNSHKYLYKCRNRDQL